MSLEQLIGMLLNFHSNPENASLPVVFVTEEGDRVVSGVSLRRYNFDPDGHQVIEIS